MTVANASVAMATTILDELDRHGIRHVVITPGSRSAALSMTALALGFEVDVHLDERSAAFHALGLGRVGRIAPVITTSGTAVANLFPAVAEADLSNTPLIVLSADRPPELKYRGANQTMDQMGIFGSRTRWAFDPGPAEDTPEQVRTWRSMTSRAVAVALGGDGLPGPVHLNLPFREPLVPSSNDGRVSTTPFATPIEGRPDGAPWTEPSLPRRPRLLRSGDGDRTLVLIGDTGVPVEIDLDGVAFVAEPHSGHRGSTSLSGLHYLATHDSADAYTPDRVITIGRVGLSRPLSTWLDRVETRVIDPTGRWSDASAHDTSTGVPAADPAWLDSLQTADAAIRGGLAEEMDSWTELSEPRIVRDTARAAADVQAHLVVASSMPIRDLNLFADVADTGVYANRGVSGIDGFVSTALGVAQGSESPVVALAGDLSMLHDSNGFLLAERPDCVFVVMNNDGGGIFSFLPQAQYRDSFERLFGTPHGRSFADLAALHGLGHVAITRPSDTTAMVAEALETPGINLVVATTNRTNNVDHHSRLTRAAHEALDALG